MQQKITNRTICKLTLTALAIFVGCQCLLVSLPSAAAQTPETGFEVPQRTVPQGDSLAEMAARQNSPNATPEKIVATKRLTEVIIAGGPLMIPIGICSFILVVFVFERAISLRKGRIIPAPFVKRFLEQLREGELNRETATALCEKNDSPVARVFKGGITKWGRSSVEVEQAILDSGERVTNELRRYLRMINGIATVTPLLGLLGTVLGMIQAFDSIGAVTGAMGDAKSVIATGISTALITTAAGMSVAIPALIAYLYFSSVVDRRVMEIDSLGMKLVGIISAEAFTEEVVQRPVKTSKKAA
jgi:biopolymer transport protein ExbB